MRVPSRRSSPSVAEEWRASSAPFQRGSATLMTGVRLDDCALAGGLAACLAATEPVPLNPTCAAAHGSRFRRSGHDRCSGRVRCDGGLFEDTLSLRRLR